MCRLRAGNPTGSYESSDISIPYKNPKSRLLRTCMTPKVEKKTKF